MMTVLQFARCVGASATRASERYGAYVDAMPRYGITTPQRQAMFLANVGHETQGLLYSTELWGPTPQQRRYERDFSAPWSAEGANRLAFSLGNRERGDGSKFRAHGDLQSTGRANHAAARDRLRARFPAFGVPDFESVPEQLAEPHWAALSACDYVEMRGLNAVADRGAFDEYCDVINIGRHTVKEGDSNGYPDRLARLHVAYAALGIQ